jgi:integrase
LTPCLRLGLEKPGERLRCASPREIEALTAAADALEPSVGDAIVIALFTGQRQGDVLALEESGIEDGRVRFKQRKTGARVSVRALPWLVQRLAAIRERNRAAARVAPTIVVDPRSGKAWNASSFRHRFADVRAAAVAGDAERGRAACKSLADFQFLDLRDTAVTWLARASCTIPEIGSVTGHSHETIHKILKHYLVLDETINDAAMAKLKTWAEKEGVKV